MLGLGAYEDSPVAADAEEAAAAPSAVHLSIVDYDDAEPEAPEVAAGEAAAAVLGASLDDEAVHKAGQHRSVGVSGVQVSIVKKPAAVPADDAAAAGGDDGSAGEGEASAAAKEERGGAARAPYVIPDSPPGDVDPGLAERFENLAEKTRNGMRPDSVQHART
ncbi:hypothetical protein EMIHUDRAFT_112633 [Emiliania huxleyi CCMP1516]|uniref:Uncharacterized protein n=2 Tax=Emiliania huxleyi TaxID=2903 RepID=A0A0D3K7F2_EMIH1|nr:hypothetical protein EMIHUDRAFT_112633 [Emiliania huxleyi CCMP1516]EOD31687.1 hypothetical protein EMIHUDRAFT_112633 [Emiliania huxleyi CCMP1516]|eukprot:XP_005784116.1 hypothetical protein EMIHUDRAFT_112633 [Emiliania huxleyi CCMP1516]